MRSHFRHRRQDDRVTSDRKWVESATPTKRLRAAHEERVLRHREGLVRSVAVRTRHQAVTLMTPQRTLCAGDM